MSQSKLNQFEAPVAGIDEAGRGPLAGPVVAAAVILNPQRPITGLDDSKKISAGRRETLALAIKSDALAWSVGWADAAEIDVLNILAATMLAMRRAIVGLSLAPAGVLVDGNRLPNLTFFEREIEGVAIVGGDAKIASISAASIIAKTTRDRIMLEMDKIYPNYEFSRHKGYGTAVHCDRLREFGPCEQHRFSFAPVRAAR
jgi:ribonuclease HII